MVNTTSSAVVGVGGPGVEVTVGVGISIGVSAQDVRIVARSAISVPSFMFSASCIFGRGRRTLRFTGLGGGLDHFRNQNQPRDAGNPFLPRESPQVRVQAVVGLPCALHRSNSDELCVERMLEIISLPWPS